MLGITRRHWLTLGAGVLAAILLLTGRVTLGPQREQWMSTFS